MSRKAVLVLVILFLLFVFPRSASVAVPGQHFQNPHDLPYDVTAGRPGTFRFVTNEQRRADSIELADLRAGIERLQTLLPTVREPSVQREFAAELQRWSLHTARLEQRLNSSVGPTAATVEGRLTQMKGQRNCAICHGGVPEGPVRTLLQ